MTESKVISCVKSRFQRKGSAGGKSLVRAFPAIAVAIPLAVVSNSLSTVRADTENGLFQRVLELEAREEIRATVHAFVGALNSSFVSGETDPLGSIREAVHPDGVLSVTPPPTPLDPSPSQMVFTGIDQGVDGHGKGAVVSARSNIPAGAIKVRFADGSGAELNLRFANSVGFTPGCILWATGCSQIMLFADVHVTLDRGAGSVRLGRTVDQVHYFAHGGAL